MRCHTANRGIARDARSLKGTLPHRAASGSKLPTRVLRIDEQGPVDFHAIAVPQLPRAIDRLPPHADRAARQVVLRKLRRYPGSRDRLPDGRALGDLEADQLLLLRQREHDLDVQGAFRRDRHALTRRPPRRAG